MHILLSYFPCSCSSRSRSFKDEEMNTDSLIKERDPIGKPTDSRRFEKKNSKKKKNFIIEKNKKALFHRETKTQTHARDKTRKRLNQLQKRTRERERERNESNDC